MRALYFLIVLGMTVGCFSVLAVAEPSSTKPFKPQKKYIIKTQHTITSNIHRVKHVKKNYVNRSHPQKMNPKQVKSNQAGTKKINLTPLKQSQLLKPLRYQVPPLQPPPTLIYGWQALANQLNNAIYSDSYQAKVGVYIKSMKYGDALYTKNINSSMTPASTLKILTAEAALLYLGSQYRFSTQILTDGTTLKNGVLYGNLYIVLGGDPTLTYYDLVNLVLTLKQEGIYAITGHVFIDNTAYDGSFYGPDWSWEDKGYCYAAPISASIINRNCLSFKVKPSSRGQLAQIETSSRYFYPTIKNSVITKSYGARACSVRLAPGDTDLIALEGCIPAGNEWGVSYVVADVNAYTRSLFYHLLKRSGVHVYGSVTFGSAPEALTLLASHTSKTLQFLINDMLKKSDNVIAGAIFKKLGQLYTHRPGSWANGGYAVLQILSKYTGMGIAGSRILDGSGLSPSNLTTPAQMMQVLNFAYHHPSTSEEFISALPIAGIDGTLKHRMGNIARKVRAKTGTISGVIGLAGYAISADKEPIAFVIMINGNKGLSWRYRQMEDNIALILTRYKRN